MRRNRLGILLIGLILIGVCPRLAAAADILMISDIHFNPTANKGLVDRLAAAAPEQWLAIFADDRSRMSGYGEDYTALEQMRPADGLT